MQGKALWDSFSEAGFRVCVFNYPMLYPAYPTNGIMISGLMSPQEGSITYPPELRADLDRLTDGYAFQVPFNDPSYAGKEHAVASEFTHLLHKHAIETKKLLSQEPWDLFIGVIGVTDMSSITFGSTGIGIIRNIHHPAHHLFGSYLWKSGTR